MEPLIISTRRSGFVMPERILSADAACIRMIAHVEEGHDQEHTGIEILAQAGALHVRHMCGFDQHAFLLKIESYTSETAGLTQGPVTVTGSLSSRSRLAFAYDLVAKKDGTLRCKGHFLFALRDYDDDFQRSLIETHYRNLFVCLTSDTPSG
jgi:hypothetical protein